MKLTKEKILDNSLELGWELGGSQAERLSQYCELLFFWSRKHNLIGPSAKERFWEEHLAPCLWLGFQVEKRPGLADLGSGAGLPGLVLACLSPEKEIHLFEARRKRVSFLKTVAAEVGLDRVLVHWERVGEEVSPQGALLFKTLTARAVGSTAGLLEPAGHLLAEGGSLFILTGPRVAAGLQDDLKGNKDWRFVEKQTEKLYGRQANLVILKKTSI